MQSAFGAHLAPNIDESCFAHCCYDIREPLSLVPHHTVRVSQAPPALRNGGLIRVFTLPKFRVKGGSAVDPAAAAQEGAASAGGKKGANAAAATKKPRKKSSACAAAGGAKRGGASARAAGGKQQQKRGRISIADSPVVKNKENDREQRELNAYRGADWREVEAMEVRGCCVVSLSTRWCFPVDQSMCRLILCCPGLSSIGCADPAPSTCTTPAHTGTLGRGGGRGRSGAAARQYCATGGGRRQWEVEMMIASGAAGAQRADAWHCLPPGAHGAGRGAGRGAG